MMTGVGAMEKCGILMNYDLIVVGAGLFGSVVACEARRNGLRVLVLDRCPTIG